MVYRVTKKPWLGAIFVIIFGPFGFLYYSWKKTIVAFLLFFLPNIMLYNLDSTLAEIIRWSVQFLMAIYVYFDLNGRLSLLEDAFSVILSTISIPIIFLNLFGGIVSSIWLIILGQWKLVIVAFIISLFVPWAYSIVSLVQMPIMALIVYMQKKGVKKLYLIFGFINILISHVIILFYAFFILNEAILISISREINIFALLLFGYGIATAPFGYMASKEGKEAYASILAVFVAQISYIIFGIGYLFNYPGISIPIILLIVFGIEIFQLYLASQEYKYEVEEQNIDVIENETYRSILENEIQENNNSLSYQKANEIVQKITAIILKYDKNSLTNYVGKFYKSVNRTNDLALIQARIFWLWCIRYLLYHYYSTSEYRKMIIRSYDSYVKDACVCWKEIKLLEHNKLVSIIFKTYNYYNTKIKEKNIDLSILNQNSDNSILFGKIVLSKILENLGDIKINVNKDAVMLPAKIVSDVRQEINKCLININFPHNN